MCDPEIMDITFDSNIPILPYCQTSICLNEYYYERSNMNNNYKNNNINNNNININEKNYRLQTRYVREIERTFFNNDKCNKAYEIIMKDLNENLENEGESRREYIGRLFNFLTWMLNSQYSLMFKKDIRLRHIFGYADNRAEHFISKLTSNNENILSNPLLSILINYRLIWKPNRKSMII